MDCLLELCHLVQFVEINKKNVHNSIYLMRIWSQQLLVKNCIFWVQNVLSKISKILMDILLLPYTRFSFSLKKVQLAAG